MPPRHNLARGARMLTAILLGVVSVVLLLAGLAFCAAVGGTRQPIPVGVRVAARSIFILAGIFAFLVWMRVMEMP